MSNRSWFFASQGKQQGPFPEAQLREFIAWSEEVLGSIESGAIVAPGEQERLMAEASAVAHLLDLLDSSADEPASGGNE